MRQRRAGSAPETRRRRVSGAPEATLYVCSGALVQGGVFDLSCGSIWLGAGALVEPGVLVRGPAVIGEGTVRGHGC